jgi:hypothetical protein
VEECKEFVETAEVVNKLSVDQMKLKMNLVLAAQNVLLVSFLIEPLKNVTEQTAQVDKLFKSMEFAKLAQIIASLIGLD